MSKGTVTQLYNEGIRQANQRNWRKALELLNKAIAKDPNHVNTYNALGMVHMQSGNSDAARKYWLKALKLDTHNPTAIQCLASYNTKVSKRYVRRIIWPLAFVIVLAAFVTSNIIWTDQIKALRDQLIMSGSSEDEEQHVEVEYPEEGQTQQKTQQAAVKPTASIPDAPPHILELYNSGLADCKERKYDSAMKHFRQILEYPSNHSLMDNAQYWLAECYYAQGQYTQALVEFQKVKENFPEDNKVFDSELMVGYTHCRLGNIEQARQKLIQLSQEFPGEIYQSSIATLSEKIQSIKSQQADGTDKNRNVLGTTGRSETPLWSEDEEEKSSLQRARLVLKDITSNINPWSDD